jgi:hypothetical protein
MIGGVRKAVSPVLYTYSFKIFRVRVRVVSNVNEQESVRYLAILPSLNTEEEW